MAKATGIGVGELKRFTGLLGGRHLYEEPGKDPQLVVVNYIEGDAWVTFLDVEEEDGEVTHLAQEMAGTFRKVMR